MWQKLKNIYHLLTSNLAAIYFNFPSKNLTIIGVTGTDGKTTTTHMIYEILRAAGKKVALISSISAIIDGKSIDTGFHVTTPSPFAMQRFLKKIVDSKSEYVVVEVTSHGLDQNRVANIHFNVGVVTNITHEHLDYHKTWENYAKAKAKLFENADVAILNEDDKSFDLLRKIARRKILTYSQTKKADFNLKNTPLKLKIPGGYNLSNALAATAAASSLKIAKTTITHALNNFKGISGRMESIDMGQDFEAIVDFAHTPNALEQALKSLKSKVKNQKSKVIAVFGSAGERDFAKRQLMGAVAAEFADVSVITAEDPRSEKVEDISAEIAKGFSKNKKVENKDFYKVDDREKAIEFAVDLAEKGDVVAAFGKSHEKSMCYGKIEYPWDEFAAVEKAIRKKLNAK